MNGADTGSGKGRVIDTVIGPIRLIPECKVQAVCVKGLRCWEAGRCLRADEVRGSLEPARRGTREACYRESDDV